MPCTFITVGPNLHRCGACGLQVSSPHPAEQIHARCRGTARLSSPQAGRTIAHPTSLASDVAQYLLNGQAGVSAVEIERRLAVCRGCESFTGDNCRRLCVCCARQRDWFWGLVGFGRNPQHCPRGRWERKGEGGGRKAE
jgi:hypothetical protein